MFMDLRRLLTIALLFASLFAVQSAHAVRLEVGPDAPFWAHFGAATLLFLHIGGGTAGLVTGVTAIAARKGGTVHRRAGRVFFGSMFVAYLIGALVAPFLSEGQRPNFVAAVLALYLLISGVMTARRRAFRAGLAEKVGLGIALTITAMGILFANMGANSATGTVDGSPPQAFIVFIVVGSVAAAGEINVLARGEISEVARRVRHLWRMCCSFFIASGSLFLGQPQLFSDWFNASILPTLFATAPILVMVVWVVKLRAVPLLKR